MTRILFKTTINKPKTEVWPIVADLASVQNYNPGVTKSYYNSKEKAGVGASRICELAPMGIIEERATNWDEGNSYRLHILPVEKVPGFKNAYADFNLKEINANETEVSLEFVWDMKYGFFGQVMNALMVRKQFETGLQGLLDGLKIHIETGRIIHGFKDLKVLDAA